METHAKVILLQRKGYKEVFIYYSKNGLKFRESTKVKILDTAPNLEEALKQHNESIRRLQSQVESLILEYVSRTREKPSAAWLKIEFEKFKLRLQILAASIDAPITCSITEEIGIAEVEIAAGDEIITAGKSIEDNLLFYWPDFIQYKRRTTRNKDSLKRYNNLATNLWKFWSRYCDHGYEKIGLGTLDEFFFIDFLRYLIKEHEYERVTYTKDPTLIALPQVGLSNSTAIKRLSDLVEYLKYCKRKQHVLVSIDDIHDYIKLARHQLSVSIEDDDMKWYLALTPEELQFAVNLRKYEPDYYASLTRRQKRYLCIFIFMCLQGTSPVDTKKITKTSVFRHSLQGKRSKSKVPFRVELDEISEGILKTYDYNLNFCSQSLNDALKKMFVSIFELYKRRFEKKYGEEYEMIWTQRTFKGDQEILLIQHKGLFVEAMTGRRTFITMLNEDTNEINLKINMRRTGHRRIVTHLRYQKDRQTGKPQKRSLFGITLEPL